MPVSDDELIERIRGGAKHLYARLIDRYKDRAMTLSVRILKNREDAEEATQDAFVRAYNGLDKFEGNAKFGTWFYRIVYNVCLSRLGHTKDELLRVEYDDEKGYDVSSVRTVETGMQEFETHDMVDFIHRCIETLPAKYSTVLSLFYVQELSYEEIVEVTQLPLGTIKVRLFRARALLQERIQQEFQIKSAV
jgi:RNA polymerase sigma factor (sigma-70 family)